MREQTQCRFCDLVQFRTTTNICRRCGVLLPEYPPVTELKPDLPPPESPAPQWPPCPAPLGMIPPLEETIRRAVLDALDKCEGNVMLAAKCLKVGKTTLYRYLRLWGWSSPHARAAVLKRENLSQESHAVDTVDPVGSQA